MSWEVATGQRGDTRGGAYVGPFIKTGIRSTDTSQMRSHGKEPQMPELMVDFITSLDGYGAADGWPGFWGLEGPEYLAWLGDQPEADYTVLMGANTYRLMSGLASDGEPGTDALADLSKIVFSTP